jgi:hypothetical protein
MKRRQYLRPLGIFGRPFEVLGAGELIAWSRILDDEEALCVVNGHGTAARGGDVLVDAGLNPAGSAMTVVLNTAAADGSPAAAHRLDSARAAHSRRQSLRRDPRPAAFRGAGAGQSPLRSERHWRRMAEQPVTLALFA